MAAVKIDIFTATGVLCGWLSTNFEDREHVNRYLSRYSTFDDAKP